MTLEELAEFENRGIPSLSRPSDRLEARADEKQDVISSLNFPLHWTTAKDSWVFLYDFSIACQLLSPRPDDLVLDFAAGTCWATEMLNRVGVRTVAIDLSHEMMRRGRQRLTEDARLAFRSDAWFVAARGQMLPFAGEVFDGVLCLNALHHVPSYEAALREIHRVLKPGGRAVFSEPGTAHTAAPLSAFRMREEQIIEKSVSLPHVRRLATALGFTRMTVVPLRSATTYVFDYTAGTGDDERLRSLWDDTLQHSPREHARFVLYKGEAGEPGEAPADTLLAPPALTGRLAAEIELRRVVPAARSGEPFIDRLRIRNTGTVTWKARGRRFGGQVTCGVRICNSDGDVLREDLGRTPLPYDVGPGASVELDVVVDGALQPGRYLLRYDMVVEGVTWFEAHGSVCPRRDLEVD
jgi:SAM-dependent methyltransferase